MFNNKLSDYQNALIHVKDIPKIYLGQEVKTSLGKGIVVRLNMVFNGLFLEPNTSTAVVWFSTDSAKSGWVCKEFILSEVKANYRKEKLEALNNIQS